MIDKTWSYCLPDYGDSYPDGAKRIEDVGSCYTHEMIAELAAEQEHYHGIGLDCDWPLMIELFKDGNTKGIYEVWIEEPSLYSRPSKPRLPRRHHERRKI